MLRALDYFLSEPGAEPDPAMAEAVEVVRSKRQPDERPLLDRIHPGRVHIDIEDGVGAPSRWNTLRSPPSAPMVGQHLTAQLFAFTLALRIFLIAAAGTFWSNLIWKVSLRTL